MRLVAGELALIQTSLLSHGLKVIKLASEQLPNKRNVKCVIQSKLKVISSFKLLTIQLTVAFLIVFLMVFLQYFIHILYITVIRLNMKPCDSLRQHTPW